MSVCLFASLSCSIVRFQQKIILCVWRADEIFVDLWWLFTWTVFVSSTGWQLEISSLSSVYPSVCCPFLWPSHFDVLVCLIRRHSHSLEQSCHDTCVISMDHIGGKICHRTKCYCKCMVYSWLFSVKYPNGSNMHGYSIIQIPLKSQISGILHSCYKNVLEILTWWKIQHNVHSLSGFCVKGTSLFISNNLYF